MIGGQLGHEPAQIDGVDPLGLGPLGQVGRAGGQADVHPVGHGQGPVAGVVELGDLVVAHPHVDSAGPERIDGLEAAAGPA